MRKALEERLTQTEAIEAVGRLLSAFPNGSPANAKGYLGALAALLGTYPRALALRCCDPLNGVARDTRFLPTIADLVAWLDRETNELRGIVDREDHHDKLAREQRERAEADAIAAAKRQARPTYDDLKAKYGPDWGITNPDRKPVQRPDEARAALIADIGQEAFDALPDTGVAATWRKPIPQQPQREAAE